MTAENLKTQPNIKVFQTLVNNALAVTKYFGIFPLDRNFQGSVFLIAYSTVLFMGTFSVGAYVVVNLNEMNRKLYSSPSRYMIDQTVICLTVLNACSSMIFGIYSIDKFREIIAKIEFVDSFLGQYGFDLRYSNRSTYCFCFLRILAIGTLCYITKSEMNPMLHNVEKFMFLFGIIISHFVGMMLEFQHNFFLSLLTERYKLIARNVINFSLNKQARDLEAFVKVYDILASLGDTINEIYGKQFLGIVGAKFLILTSSANCVVQNIQARLTNEGGYFLLESIYYNLYKGVEKLLELWSVISNCEDNVEQAKEFTESLYQLMMEDDKFQICKNKKLILHISSQKVPSFTASGFFNLDNTLLHSVVAAATTYLVILIQFTQIPSDHVQMEQNFTAVR